MRRNLRVGLLAGVWLVVGMGCSVHSDVVERYAGLGELRQVDSSSTGYGGGPGKFYLVAQKIMREASVSELREMLRSDRPVVRAMGIVCLSRYLPETEKDIRGLYGDTAVVGVVICCIGIHTPVGTFAKDIVEEKGYTDWFISPRNRVVTRSYPFKLNGESGEKLVEFVKAVIAPDTWQEGAIEDVAPAEKEKRGDEAKVADERFEEVANTIEYLDGKLVVTHTVAVQVQVKSLLDELAAVRPEKSIRPPKSP